MFAPHAAANRKRIDGIMFMLKLYFQCVWPHPAHRIPHKRIPSFGALIGGICVFINIKLNLYNVYLIIAFETSLE